jgi:hypothetical protein
MCHYVSLHMCLGVTSANRGRSILELLLVGLERGGVLEEGLQPLHEGNCTHTLHLRNGQSLILPLVVLKVVVLYINTCKAWASRVRRAALHFLCSTWVSITC